MRFRGAAGWRTALSAALLVTAVAVAAPGCGGDDCSGVLSFNVDPAECESLAEQFGCSSFDIDGPSCGLFGCATCGDIDDDE
jgi:hypothetical protein